MVKLINKFYRRQTFFPRYSVLIFLYFAKWASSLQSMCMWRAMMYVPQVFWLSVDINIQRHSCNMIIIFIIHEQAITQNICNQWGRRFESINSSDSATVLNRKLYLFLQRWAIVYALNSFVLINQKDKMQIKRCTNMNRSHLPGRPEFKSSSRWLPFRQFIESQPCNPLHKVLMYQTFTDLIYARK